MTELEIDKSHLPRVLDVCQCFAVLEDGALAHNLQEQEIEHFYNSNVQKNQLVQHDVRIARRMQDEEEHSGHLSHSHIRHRLEEQDFEYAQRIQEEMQRQAEEARRREEEDEEMAKRLQEEEELQIRRRRAEAGCADTPLSEGLISLQLEVLQQVQRDAELARRLQEEDEEEEADMQPQRRVSQSMESPQPQPQSQQHPQSQPKSPSAEEPDVDFRAAQVAQDEEIAHYMQRHDRRGHRRSSENPERQSRSLEQQDTPRREAPLRKVGALQLPRERLNSEGLHSPGEEGSPERRPSLPTYTMIQAQPIHNIAEELDPTFKARKRESLQMANSAPSGICLANRTPHSVFYDYLPEPAFIPPTKRQSDKSGRSKAKEKKENCKQQ